MKAKLNFIHYPFVLKFLKTKLIFWPSSGISDMNLKPHETQEMKPLSFMWVLRIPSNEPGQR